MTRTKEINIEIDGSTYEVSIDYEQDGTICAICIEGDLKEILDGNVFENIEESFNGSFNDE